MNANITKLISSAAVVLAMGSSVYAQNPNQNQNKQVCPCPPYEMGTGLTNCEKFPAAYNAPARTEVKCSWDVFATASFIYWYEDQEGMDVGYNTAQVTTAAPLPASGGQFAFPHFQYKPGFKVGLGYNCDFDNWVACAEYTWLHGRSTNTMTPAADARGTGVFALSNWFDHRDAIDTPGVLTATSVSTNWRLNLDMVDASLSRPFYQGRKLTVTPFAGLRALWVRQNYRISAVVPNSLPVAGGTLVSHNNSHSWAVGPRAGMQGHWLLGWGFRVEGDMGASALFTRYKVQHRESSFDSTVAADSGPSYQYHRYNTVRPMTEMGMGIGWGSYLDCQNYHIDIAANYDFNVLWGQNVMRRLVDDYSNGSGSEPADLHYQGLTLTARFDF
jgi:hypothetical protein